MNYKIILNQQSGLGPVRRLKLIDSYTDAIALIEKELDIPINCLVQERISLGVEDRNDPNGSYATRPDMGIDYFATLSGDYAYLIKV